MEGSLDGFVGVLMDELKNNNLSVETCLEYVAKIMLSITDNLEVLRINGYFYSDLKSDNILYKIYGDRFKLFIADLGGIYDMIDKGENGNPIFTFPPYFNNDIIYRMEGDNMIRYFLCGNNPLYGRGYLKSFFVKPSETNKWDDNRIKASLIWLISYNALYLLTILLAKDYGTNNPFRILKSDVNKISTNYSKINPNSIYNLIEVISNNLDAHIIASGNNDFIIYLYQLINIIKPSHKAQLVDATDNEEIECNKKNFYIIKRDINNRGRQIIKRCKNCIKIDDIIIKYHDLKLFVREKNLNRN